jgi:hypothetical protein
MGTFAFNPSWQPLLSQLGPLLRAFDFSFSSSEIFVFTFALVRAIVESRIATIMAGMISTSDVDVGACKYAG